MKHRWLSRFPLFLPPGSVRAVLAIMLVGSVVWMAIDRRIDPSLVVAMAASAIPIYFESKQRKDAETPTPDEPVTGPPPAPPVVGGPRG